MKAGNFVSEWFGYRTYPEVAIPASGLKVQQAGICPFLSKVLGSDKDCVKAQSSKGVCTVSSNSNGSRQDWLVCPYRVFGSGLISEATCQVFGIDTQPQPLVIPAPRLRENSVQKDALEALKAGKRVFVYFDQKLGGEISLPKTDQSPEFSFDVVQCELVLDGSNVLVGRFGVIEIQTMDFHGSYKAVVKNLNDGLRLHEAEFPEMLSKKQEWLGQNIEGPNIANVFKRTFYQMVFKFQLAQHASCAGVVLCLPSSVWDSWQRHLGAPALIPKGGNRFALHTPGSLAPTRPQLWIYVFDVSASVAAQPSNVVVSKIIETDADALPYFALKESPKYAVPQVDLAVVPTIHRRLAGLWPAISGVAAS